MSFQRRLLPGEKAPSSRTSWSRYHPQTCMLPPCSSMHLVNCCVAPWQLLPQLWLAMGAVWPAACTCCSAGAAGAEPPPKKPPMAWPMELPTATPLSFGVHESVVQARGKVCGERKRHEDGAYVRGGAGHLAEEAGALRGGRGPGCVRRLGGRGRVGGGRPGLLLLGRGGCGARGDARARGGARWGGRALARHGCGLWVCLGGVVELTVLGLMRGGMCWKWVGEEVWWKSALLASTRRKPMEKLGWSSWGGSEPGARRAEGGRAQG